MLPKKKELTSIVFKILFKNSRVLLELLLAQSKIKLTYLILNQNSNLTLRIVIIMSTSGNLLGFVISYYAAATNILTLLILLSSFIVKSIRDQYIHESDFLNVKYLINEMLEDNN